MKKQPVDSQQPGMRGVAITGAGAGTEATSESTQDSETSESREPETTKSVASKWECKMGTIIDYQH